MHWKVRSGLIAFAEPTHREVTDAILECGLATEVGQRLGSAEEVDVYLFRDGRRSLVVKVYRVYRTTVQGPRNSWPEVKYGPARNRALYTAIQYNIW